MKIYRMKLEQQQKLKTWINTIFKNFLYHNTTGQFKITNFFKNTIKQMSIWARLKR